MLSTEFIKKRRFHFITFDCAYGGLSNVRTVSCEFPVLKNK